MYSVANARKINPSITFLRRISYYPMPTNWYNYLRNTSRDKVETKSCRLAEYEATKSSRQPLLLLLLTPPLSLSLRPLIRPKALKRLVRIVWRGDGHDWTRKKTEGGEQARSKREERTFLRKIRENGRGERKAGAAILRRGGKSRFHSSARPISRMPAGCVYFVSFYITRYPRDLDSIYFLLALRLECTRPIFDVGGRIFSGRNDRWIFLYFHSSSFLPLFSSCSSSFSTTSSDSFPVGNSCFV